VCPFHPRALRPGKTRTVESKACRQSDGYRPDMPCGGAEKIHRRTVQGQCAGARRSQRVT
jgi:hypothetical protein